MPPELARFMAEISFLLKPNSPHAHSLNYFIRRLLRQFDLNIVYTENDILNEAYLRGVRLTRSGTAILCPEAWVRKTALNIIREESRKARRHRPVELDGLADNERDRLEKAVAEDREDVLVYAEAIAADVEAVITALQELSESDRAILQLKIVEGYSWRQISQSLIDAGEPWQSEAALRKRKQRILEQIRKLYHQQSLPI